MTTLKLFAYQEQFMRNPTASGELMVNVADEAIVIGILGEDDYGISLTHEEFNKVCSIVERARIAKLVATGEAAPKKSQNDDYR